MPTAHPSPSAVPRLAAANAINWHRVATITAEGLALGVVIGAAVGLAGCFDPKNIPVPTKGTDFFVRTAASGLTGLMLGSMLAIVLLAYTFHKPRGPIIASVLGSALPAGAILAANGLPLIFTPLGSAWLTAILAIFIARSAVPDVAAHPTPWACDRCGYDLRGLRHDNPRILAEPEAVTCPECGARCQHEH